MRIFGLIVHFAVSYLLFTSPILSQIDVNAISESIVRVCAHDRNKIAAEGSGFVINAEGYVLTNAHLLSDAERLTVISLKTGAEIVAQQVFAKRDMNLALLRVQGLGLPALNLSEQGTDVDRAVLTLKFGTADSVYISQGKIVTHHDVTGTRSGDPVIHLLKHTAIVTSKAFGMPVFNECGDVVAINLPDPRGRWPFRRNAEPTDIMFALRSGDIITTLKDREIANTVVEEACLSAAERAIADSIKTAADSIRAAKARADSIKQAATDSIKAAADSIKTTADSLKAAAERTDAANRAARTRADSATQAAADSIKAAEARVESERMARLAAEREKARADSINQAKQEQTSQQLAWIIIGSAGLVLVVLLGWLVSSQRKKAQLQNTASRLSEAEQEAEAARQAAANAPQPAPFGCILEGHDNTGRSFALRISALALGDQSGVILGRSTNKADFVIDHEAVSREHVRLTYTKGEFVSEDLAFQLRTPDGGWQIAYTCGELFAEDLETTNGTQVNGQPLHPRQQARLQNNDQLAIGPVVFNVRLVSE